jgi:hypothetical protein
VTSLGSSLVEFATAGDLATLLDRLSANTPIRIAGYLREDPALRADDVEERLTYAAEQAEGGGDQDGSSRLPWSRSARSTRSRASQCPH